MTQLNGNKVVITSIALVSTGMRKTVFVPLNYQDSLTHATHVNSVWQLCVQLGEMNITERGMGLLNHRIAAPIRCVHHEQTARLSRWLIISVRRKFPSILPACRWPLRWSRQSDARPWRIRTETGVAYVYMYIA